MFGFVLCSDHGFGWNVDGVQKIQSFSGDAQISEAEISRGMIYMCSQKQLWGN